MYLVNSHAHFGRPTRFHPLAKNMMSNNCLIHFLLLLLPAVVATTPSSYSYTLAPQANEGYWHEMPVSVRNHLNKTGAATRFWRKSGRHPSNTFHDVAGLALDQFSIGVWVKLNPQFWQTFRSVCVFGVCVRGIHS